MTGSTRSALLIAGLFLAGAILLGGVLPLWLDEILQLIETREPSTARMIENIPRNSGAAPLGYIVQQGALKVTRYSVRRARLPAAVFAAASVAAVGILAGQFGLRHTWLAALIFALLPMTVRYATESRLYSQALFFSVLATILFVRLQRTPSSWNAILYGLALTLGAYTHAYTASVGLAHLAWALAHREKRTAVLAGAALASAVLAFLPWYVYSKAGWAASVIPDALYFSASWKTPLMLFREIAGAGYWGSGLLAILCVLGVRSRLLSPRTTALLLLAIVVPLVSIFTADAIFDYFIAARQFLWVLPAIALLAAAAFERPTPAAVLSGVLLVAVCVWQNVRYFTDPREDWRQAAAAIENYIRQDACLAVAPPDHARFYEFFEPALSRALCQGPRVVVAVTPYASAEERASALEAMARSGYNQAANEIVGKSELLTFEK